MFSFGSAQAVPMSLGVRFVKMEEFPNPIRDELKKLNPKFEFRWIYECETSWEKMEIIDKNVRHCKKCDLNVFDLTDKSKDEISSLIKSHNGKICGIVYFQNHKLYQFDDCQHKKEPAFKLGIIQS